MLENSTYSVISPEGAASILWKDATLAKQAAEAMKITAPDLKEMDIIDEVIQEVQGGAHRNPEAQAKYMKDVLLQSFDKFLVNFQSKNSLKIRYDKFRAIGEFTEDNDVVNRHRFFLLQFMIS